MPPIPRTTPAGSSTAHARLSSGETRAVVPAGNPYRTTDVEAYTTPGEFDLTGGSNSRSAPHPGSFQAAAADDIRERLQARLNSLGESQLQNLESMLGESATRQLLPREDVEPHQGRRGGSGPHPHSAHRGPVTAAQRLLSEADQREEQGRAARRR